MTGSSTGQAARIRMLREAAYNTAPSADFWNIPIISTDLGTTQDDEPNPTIAHGSDPAAPLRGVFEGKSELSAPLDARYFGLHLAALFGDPATTDETSHFKHVFESGATGQPVGQAIEVAHLGLDTPKYAMNTGVLYSGFSLSLKRAGFVEVKFDVIATKEVWSGASGAGTPADLEDDTIRYFSHLTGVIKREGVALGTILSGDLSFSYNLDALEVVANNGYIGGADRAQASWTANFSARFRDSTLLDDAVSGAPVQIDWILSNSADEKITFTQSNVTLSRPKIPLSGPGGVNASFRCMGHGTASEKMLTVTLLNDHDGTAYAE